VGVCCLTSFHSRRGGARIHNIFFTQFAKAMETINPMEGLSEQELLIAMQNTVV